MSDKFHVNLCGTVQNHTDIDTDIDYSFFVISFNISSNFEIIDWNH